MADVNPRHRVFCWVFDLMGWLRVQDMSPGSLRRHRKPLSPPWAAHLVQGKVREDVTFRDETIEGPTGAPLRLRVYTPDGVPLQDRPLVINLHGGGWVLANVEMTEWMCGQLAGRLGAVVVSVDYRLAPEYPAPAAYDDCWHAVGHLLQHASEYGIDPNRGRRSATARRATSARCSRSGTATRSAQQRPTETSLRSPGPAPCGSRA